MSITGKYIKPDETIFPEQVLAVSFVGGVPVIPKTVEGRPINLDNYRGFLVTGPKSGETREIPRDTFFHVFIPSRLFFQGAGRG